MSVAKSKIGRKENPVVIGSGIIIPGLVLFPNIIYYVRTRKRSNVRENHASVSIITNIGENVGRLGILVIPSFYSLNLDRRFSPYFTILCLLLVSLYYIAWLRHFVGGSDQIDMRKRLLVPLPLAVYPSLFLICSSYLLSSVPMLIVSIVFAIAHIRVSHIEG
jgi:hypothetical protein